MVRIQPDERKKKTFFELKYCLWLYIKLLLLPCKHGVAGSSPVTGRKIGVAQLVRARIADVISTNNNIVSGEKLRYFALLKPWSWVRIPPAPQDSQIGAVAQLVEHVTMLVSIFPD